MKKFSIALPIIAFVIAIGTSAFIKVQQLDSDLVWFKIDPQTGQPLNASSGGMLSDTDPFSCDVTQTQVCSVALSISQGEVTQNSGTYGIAPGVDPLDDADATHYERE